MTLDQWLAVFDNRHPLNSSVRLAMATALAPPRATCEECEIARDQMAEFMEAGLWAMRKERRGGGAFSKVSKL